MAAECVEESIDFLSQDHHGADLALSFVEGVDQSSNTMDNSTRDNEIPCKSVQSDLIQDCLSCIGVTSSGNGIAYLNLSLKNKALCDVTLISSYTHLRKIDLSHNQLKDLAPLSYLRSLTDINVSHNRICNMLTFSPPTNIQCMDYSYNEIEELPNDLDKLSTLQTLIMDGNQLTSLKGLSVLTCLTYLSLSDNRLDSIEGLDNLPLQTLILSGNSISSVVGLQSLKLLQCLNLSSNQIVSLEGLSGFDYLSEINLEENQIVDFKDIYHLEGLTQLISLDLRKNPIQSDPSYKQFVIVTLRKLLRLDGHEVLYQEKVSANNRYSPSMSYLASQNHMQNVVKAIKKQARLNFSTLTQPDEPYPMLILCGPIGSGKEIFAQQLVEEFPSFFGLGVSHTTKPQSPNESHGRDYYFINEATFKRAVDAGEFIVTSYIGGHWYGLTMATIEQVAQQGLACVCHLTLEAVLSLKLCHFEPRYILLLPLNKQVHEERIRGSLMEGSCYDNPSIVLEQVDKYLSVHRERPGFFDATINTDKLKEGYNILRTIVMAYGGISPDTPLTLSLSVSRPTSRQTSSSLSSYGIILDDEGGGATSNPGTGVAVASMVVPMSRSAPVASDTNKTTGVNQRQLQEQLNNIACSWSRPSTSSADSQSVRESVKRAASDDGSLLRMKNNELTTA